MVDMRARTFLWAAWLSLCWASVAAAARKAARTPDGWSSTDVEAISVWAAILITLIFLFAAMAVGFKDSRRSHLD